MSDIKGKIKQLKMGRMEAASKGYNFFYTGKPCAKGHDDLRYVSNGNCVTCIKLGTKQYRDHLMDLKSNAKGE